MLPTGLRSDSGDGGITKETKTKLLSASAGGQGIDLWLFQFIRHDPEFQGVLFRTAEDAHNWQFLERLREYRAQQRRAALPPATVPSPRRTDFRPPPPRPRQRDKPQRPTPSRGRKNHKPLRRPLALPPLDPKTLPPEKVMKVSSRDFTFCPRCKLRVFAKVLQDHLELSCPQRGRGASGSPAWSGPSYDEQTGPIFRKSSLVK